MDSYELRKKHATFTYKSFEVRQETNELIITFHFTISPDIEFKPVLKIPLPLPAQGQVLPSTSGLDNFIFNLGMIEAISYWKLTCSPRFVIEAGFMEKDQINWWHNLFLHGLGEFFYKNQIDFSGDNFLTIDVLPTAPRFAKILPKNLSGDLLLAGGGKDTAVMFELLQEVATNKQVMLLNPMQAAAKITEVAGFKSPILVKRTLDPKLLELNKKGYLNGHTPFSAYLAFLGTFVAYLHGYNRVLVANEASAAEASLVFHNMEINHQYSKSWEFEKAFYTYVTTYLTPQVSYFSLLRPLIELQAAALFAKTDTFDQTFCSCNVSRNTTWCMSCPKCAFVYLVLFPFLTQERMNGIFGAKNYFADPTIQKHLTDSVGLGPYKPLECVGTIAESRLAAALTIFKFNRLQLPLPQFLIELDEQLKLTTGTTEEALYTKLQTQWNENHFLPKEYQEIIKNKLSRLSS